MSVHIKLSNIIKYILILTVITSAISCTCTNPNKPQVKGEKRKKVIVNEETIKEVQSAAEKYLQEIPANEADWMRNEFNTLLETLKKVQKGEQVSITGRAVDGAVYLGNSEVIEAFIRIVKKDNPGDKKLLDGLEYRLHLAKKIKPFNMLSSFASSKELKKTRDTLKEILTKLYSIENPYDDEFDESIRQIKAEYEESMKQYEELIKQMQERSQQAKKKKEIKEEEDKRKEEEWQKLKKSTEENVKEQREIADKRAQEFMPGAEMLAVEGIKDYIDNIQRDLAEDATIVPLSKEQQEDIHLIVGEINKKIKELEEAGKNITYNINHPDIECRRDYDQEDLEIAQKLIEDLKDYKEEIRQLLEARGERLSDYETPDVSGEGS